jgi:O-antigen/teichoic acid export membrane protein
MLVNSQGGYLEMAVLAVANQWFSVVMFVPAIAGRVVLPILTEHVSDNNHDEARRVLTLAIGANAAVAVPFAIVAAILSPWIMQLYGADYRGGSVTLTVAVATAALLAVQAPVGNMVAAASRMWLGALMNLGWASIYVGLTYILIGFGSAGVMGAMGIAYLVHAMWTFAFAISQVGSGKPQTQAGA